MRRLGAASAAQNARVTRPPGSAGRRAVAAACAMAALPLAALPLAALAGCSAGPAPATAGAAAPLSASMTARPVTIQLGPSAAGAPGPGPAALAKFRWSALAGSPLGDRNSPLLAWAGGRLVEVGGWAKGSGTGRSAAGASFDLATGRWKRIAAAPAGGSFADGDTSAVWTGRYLAVASGTAAACPGHPAPAPHCWTGLTLYDPTANRWTVLAVPPPFDGLGLAAVVWTGRELIVGAVGPVNATSPDSGRLALAAYSPATRRWQTLTPPLPRGHAPGGLYLVDDDGRLVLTSQWQQAAQTSTGPQGTWGVDVLTMTAAGAWRNVTAQWPQAIAYGTTATSDGVLDTPGDFWCGDLCAGVFTNNDHSYLVNPVTLAATRIPAGPFAALESGDLNWVWAGDAILTVDAEPNPDGPTGHYVLSGDLAMYDPATQRWTELPATPGHPPLAGSSVWTGTELLNLTEAGALLAFHR
jgi:hypothetical protein